MQDEAVMTCLELMMAAVQRKEPPARFSFIQEETTETKPETVLLWMCITHSTLGEEVQRSLVKS